MMRLRLERRFLLEKFQQLYPTYEKEVGDAGDLLDPILTADDEAATGEHSPSAARTLHDSLFPTAAEGGSPSAADAHHAAPNGGTPAFSLAAPSSSSSSSSSHDMVRPL